MFGGRDPELDNRAWDTNSSRAFANLAFAMTMMFFARPWFKRDTNFLLVELILVVFFVSAFVTPELLFILILAFLLLLLVAFRKVMLGRCPSCGLLRKDTVDLFKCTVCSYQMNQWVFDNIS
jgi:hypothetical protein